MAPRWPEHQLRNSSLANKREAEKNILQNYPSKNKSTHTYEPGANPIISK